MSMMGADVGSKHCTQMLKDFTWQNERASFGKLCRDRGVLVGVGGRWTPGHPDASALER